MDTGTFLTQAFQVIQDFHQLTPHLKLISILTLCISAWKVSAFRPYWDKLGWFKTFFAPACMFILSIVNGVTGPLNIHILFNAVMIGLGSVGFHEILDAVKTIPHIGPKWMIAVNVISDLTQSMTQRFTKKPIEKT